MAVTRKTQRDIGNYEAKFIGPFTARQTICVGIGGIVSFMVSSPLLSFGSDYMTILTVIIFIMLPFVLFGWCKPYGMKMEEFIKQYYFYHILAPSIRKYETETQFDVIEKEMNKENNRNNTKNKVDKPIKHIKDPEIPDFL